MVLVTAEARRGHGGGWDGNDFADPANLDSELIPPGGNLAHDRKRLTVKMSADDGQTRPISRVLEAGLSGCWDLAQTPDGTLLRAYGCGLMERMTDTRSITVARFDLAWLMRSPED